MENFSDPCLLATGKKLGASGKYVKIRSKFSRKIEKISVCARECVFGHVVKNKRG